MVSICAIFAICILAQVQGKNLTLFWVCAVSSATAMVIFLPLHCKSTDGANVTFGWLGANVVTTLGGWIIFYGYAVAFVTLHEVTPLLASAILPFVTTFIEYSLVRVLD